METNRNNNVVKYRKPLNLNIGVVIFIVIFIYILICVFMYFTQKHIESFQVKEGSLSSNNIFEGIALREEEIVTAQSAGYINSLENQKAMPSMSVFFYICEYLKITPAEFFDTASANPTKEKELLSELKGLQTEDMDTLIALAKSLKKKQ